MCDIPDPLLAAKGGPRQSGPKLGSKRQPYRHFTMPEVAEIRRLREKEGMKLREIALRLGANPNSISNYCKGIKTKKLYQTVHELQLKGFSPIQIAVRLNLHRGRIYQAIWYRRVFFPD